ncbi:MAG: hypothetical protein OXG39_18305 [Chloroflexi bacterium]|nr:hypothetical protein [Chloroflexota bacterium]
MPMQDDGGYRPLETEPAPERGESQPSLVASEGAKLVGMGVRTVIAAPMFGPFACLAARLISDIAANVVNPLVDSFVAPLVDSIAGPLRDYFEGLFPASVQGSTKRYTLRNVEF